MDDFMEAFNSEGFSQLKEAGATVFSPVRPPTLDEAAKAFRFARHTELVLAPMAPDPDDLYEESE